MTIQLRRHENNTLFFVLDEDVANAKHHIFNKISPNWTGRSDFDQMFLRSVQTFMNDRLFVQRCLLLNDVLDALGLPRTAIGALVGWTKQSIIHFGDFLSASDGSIPLTFNIEGVVFANLGDPG